MLLCLVLQLTEWRSIVDSFLNHNLDYEVHSEIFDPSFFFVKNAKNVLNLARKENKLLNAISTSVVQVFFFLLSKFFKF